MVTVHCIPNCPACKRLISALDSKGVLYEHIMWNPDHDMKEMELAGVYDDAFPVVFIDGNKLPPMTTAAYVTYIINGGME